MGDKNLKEDYEIISKKLENFNGFISLGDDFRTFLLLVFSEEHKDPISKFMGGGKPIRNLYYDTVKSAYFSEMEAEKITTYLKIPLEIEKKILKTEDKDFFNKYLSKFEQSTLLDSKAKIQVVKYFNKKSQGSIDTHFEISKIYDNFLSLIFGVGMIKTLFVLDGIEDKPDIIFTFPIQITNLITQKDVFIHAYLDQEKICKDSQFLKLNKETYEYVGIKEIKEASHGELFKNQFMLVVHVKSFDNI